MDSLLDRFRTYLLTADERAIFRASPRALATHLGLGERAALQLLARTADLHLVELEWEVRCPECQSEACQTHHTGETSCQFCGYQYDLEIDHDVQMTFTVSASVRHLSPRADDLIYRQRLNAKSGSSNALALLNFPTFRARFADQFLQGDTGLRLRQTVILATDLRNSTSLYARHSDAVAYKFVCEHFFIIFAVIEAHNGFAVKTLGDGAMASFPTILDGLRAAEDIQREMIPFLQGRGESDLALRIGLHSGPCIVVKMNGQLDFFGATVNIAFRVARLAQGNDLLVTNTALDSETQQELATLGRVEIFRTTLHGFDDDCIIHRVALSKTN